MKDNAKRVSLAAAKATDAVAQIDAVVAPHAFYRPILDRKYDGIALTQGHDFRAALHAGALFCQHKFATCEILAGFGQQDSNLQGKGQITVTVKAGNMLFATNESDRS